MKAPGRTTRPSPASPKGGAGNAPGHRSHLTEAQRAVLIAIANKPGLSNGQVAQIFEARTGRAIYRQSVRVIRLQGGYKERPGNNHLGAKEVATLHDLILEGEGLVTFQEIADQFSGITGRAITRDAVWWHSVKILKQPGIGKGKRPRRAPASTRQRLEEASNARLERARVDRSARVGKAVKLHRIVGES